MAERLIGLEFQIKLLFFKNYTTAKMAGRRKM